MALSQYTIAEVEGGGSDTLNGGLFDPSVTSGMLTDLTCTLGTSGSPVVASASYNFASTGGVSNTGDVGAWLYIGAGTNWLAGWYKIVSVAANAATLNAAIGAAVLSTGGSTAIANGLSTALGCSTVATQSANKATWTIDYSQQGTKQLTYTDLTSSTNGNTGLTSPLNPFGQQQVGNCIQVTSGTSFTVGFYVLTAVAAGSATVVGAGSIHTSTSTHSNGAGGLGGAFGSPGIVGSVLPGGGDVFIRQATYSITSASFNVAGGCFKMPGSAGPVNLSKAIGYQTTRFDYGTRPILQASGISTFSLVQNTGGAGGVFENLIVDGANLTGSAAFSIIANFRGVRIKVMNCKSGGFVGASTVNTVMMLCEASGCSATTPFPGGICIYCVGQNNTVTAFAGYCFGCIAANNTGTTTDGFSLAVGECVSCVAYGNGRNGFQASSSSNPLMFVNCYAEGNGVSANGQGFSISSATDNPYMINCGVYDNTNVNVNTSIPSGGQIGLITLGSTAFINAAGGDFSLNNVATGGALLRAAGIPGLSSGLYGLPGLSTSSYPDVGAAQSKGGGGMLLNPGMSGGMN